MSKKTYKFKGKTMIFHKKPSGWMVGIVEASGLPSFMLGNFPFCNGTQSYHCRNDHPLKLKNMK